MESRPPRAREKRLTFPVGRVVCAPLMANTPKWNIRLRHEWLATPLKKKRIKRGQKARIGLLEAEQRKAAKVKPSKNESTER